MPPALAGQVYAIIGPGDETDRAVAIALAEAGAGVAIASVSRARAQEFAVASIANEVWAMGGDQLSRATDAADDEDVAAFAREVARQLGRCDGLVVDATLDARAVTAFGQEMGGVRVIRLGLVGEEGQGGASDVARRTSPSETAVAVVETVLSGETQNTT